MSPRRQAGTIAAFCISGAAGLALLAVLDRVAWPAIAGLLVAYGIVP